MYNKIGIGYKLFEMDASGKLYPLFIDKKEEIEIGKWIHAKNVPTKGFAQRPGWHIGSNVPDAPWLRGFDGSELGHYRSRFSKGKRVWCEVEYNMTNNYNEEVMKLKKKCFTDKIPENGFYLFNEAGRETWVISSDIKINKILSESERNYILKSKGYDEVKAYKKYKDMFEKRLKTA